MQHWRFGRVLYSLGLVLFLALSLTLLGCPDDGGSGGSGNVEDDPEAQAEFLEGRTLTFDASVIDPDLAGVNTVLAFGTANGADVDFNMGLAGNELEGTGTLSSLDLAIEIIRNAAGQTVTTITINGVVFTVNQVLGFDIEFSEDGDTVMITLINPTTGATAVFTFVGDQTGSTGTTGGQGGGGEEG
jgi:hypothetical protein